MLETQTVKTLAGRLLAAEAQCTPIGTISDEYSQITVEDAYQIQLEIIKEKVAKGKRIVGKKIGLTSLAMQNLLGVYEPDYGQLLGDMEVVDGGEISLSGLLQPKIEAEIAFILGKDLVGPGITARDVLLATEAVVPSLEVVDSRVKDWKIKIQDTVADNASSARFTLGHKLSPVRGLDLSLTGMVFSKNGHIVGTAAGAAVLGNPAVAVAWLANKLAEYDITLRAGETILSGAFTAAVVPTAGEYFEASFDRLGTVGVRFTA
jgi:2-keto-4-pentenoate hydratase